MSSILLSNFPEGDTINMIYGTRGRKLRGTDVILTWFQHTASNVDNNYSLWVFSTFAGLDAA